MSVTIYSKKRLQVIEKLPDNWQEKMSTPDSIGETVYEDEAIVYSGTDEEAKEILKKYDLLSDELEELL